MCNEYKPTGQQKKPNINNTMEISCVLLPISHLPVFPLKHNHFPEFCVYHTLTF